MRFRSAIFLIIMVFLGVSASAQNDGAVIRFVNLMPSDDETLVFYVNGRPVVQGVNPYSLNYSQGTQYLSLNAGTHTLSVREAGEADFLANTTVDITADGIYSAIVWQDLGDTAPQITFVEESAVPGGQDMDSNALFTVLFVTNLPLGLSYTLNGESLEINTSGVNVMALPAGDHEFTATISAEELNIYADAAYALFPEAEADLAVAQFQEVTGIELDDEVTEYSVTSSFEAFPNQSIFLHLQIAVSMNNIIENIEPVYGASLTNFVYARGTEDQGTVDSGDMVSGRLDTAGSRHEYTFTPTESRDYIISLSNPDASELDDPNLENIIASAINTSYDPALVIFENSNLLGISNAIVDHEGFILDTRAELTVSLTEGVTYTIQVGSVADVSGGNYNLTID